MANAEDCDTFQPGEGENLCWHILQNCDQDQEEAIDLRDAEIERLERELDAERALADRLAHWLSSLEGEGLVPPAWDASVANAIDEWKQARNPQVGYNPSPTEAEIDAHLDECLAKSEESWKPLPGDPKVFYPQL